MFESNFHPIFKAILDGVEKTRRRSAGHAASATVPTSVAISPVIGHLGMIPWDAYIYKL
jgi:hypothetical protein